MRPPVGCGGRSELPGATEDGTARVETRPLTRTVPPLPPPSTMVPLRTETERASATPDRLIACRAAFLAVAAFISIRPPSAEIRPEFFTSALWSPSSAEGSVTCRKPSPDRSSVARSPAPSPIRPRGALIVPALSTRPPISAA